MRGSDVHAALERLSANETARQHLAILRLVDRVPAGAVFDAILDPADCRELLLTVARRGDAQDIAELWFAVPRLASDPFAGSLAAALFLTLGDDRHLEEIDDAARASASTASTRNRRDTPALLRMLSTTRDDRAAVLTRISQAFLDNGAQ